MSVPLFNESMIYARKIDETISSLECSSLYRKKLVNYIHKYSTEYYLAEQERFLSDPDSYASDSGSIIELDGKVLSEKFGTAFVIKLFAKAVAHRFFRFLGALQILFRDRCSIRVIRKSYVDDVEGLFDEEEGLLRLIYPFPLNLKRQFRYIKFLKRNGLPYVFSGLPYGTVDLLKLLLHKDGHHFLRLENRAQMLHAMEMSRFDNLEYIQCAEEYEIGSLLYGKMIRRQGIEVRNCAHGAGKYLPYHSYSFFGVLTQEQQIYYRYFNRSEHSLKEVKPNNNDRVEYSGKQVICLLGQYSESAPKLLLTDEIEILKILSSLSSIAQDLVCVYKKHPNCSSIDISSYPGVDLLEGVNVGGDPELILQLSLYSTCQVDPNFIGRKELVETKFIKPALIYGEGQPIVHINELRTHLQKWIFRLEGK